MMSDQKYLDEDIVHIYKLGLPHKVENLIATLFWGDSVKVVGQTGNKIKLEFSIRKWNPIKKKYEWEVVYGDLAAKVHFRQQPLLKIKFLDVGQGDSNIIETPAGRIIVIDGGEGEQLRNYVTTAWAEVFRTKPLDLDAILVTHGDADHYAGLTDLLAAKRGYNRPLVNIQRVYHSGLVKGPDSKKETDKFGGTVQADGRLYITDLVNDLLGEQNARMNKNFIAWKKALDSASKLPGFEMRRLAYGDQTGFDFLDNEGIEVQVLGPITKDIGGIPALPFLHQGKAYSAGHTINGHSVVLRMTYGNIRFFFGADMNAESEAELLTRTRADNLSLASEIIKVPHHGSDDFDPRLLEAVRPVISIISSGDENKMSEYIHPRAGLVGALGKYSRATIERPLIYITETVAFFERVGLAHIYPLTETKQEGQRIETANAYIKKSYGIVHVRTDGKRVLVASHSGKPEQKESYAFQVDDEGQIEFEKVKIVN